jgi:hypothetical protein
MTKSQVTLRVAFLFDNQMIAIIASEGRRGFPGFSGFKKSRLAYAWARVCVTGFGKPRKPREPPNRVDRREDLGVAEITSESHGVGVLVPPHHCGFRVWGEAPGKSKGEPTSRR